MDRSVRGLGPPLGSNLSLPRQRRWTAPGQPPHAAAEAPTVALDTLYAVGAAASLVPRRPWPRSSPWILVSQFIVKFAPAGCLVQSTCLSLLVICCLVASSPPVLNILGRKEFNKTLFYWFRVTMASRDHTSLTRQLLDFQHHMIVR